MKSVDRKKETKKKSLHQNSQICPPFKYKTTQTSVAKKMKMKVANKKRRMR